MSREQFWFFFPFRVRYSEIDGQGVVFNAHYLTYFDTSITEYFRALGYDQYADSRKTGIDFHVVKSLIEYKAPVLFDQEIEVGVRVARIGNSSLVFELAIFLKGGAEVFVIGEIVWVYTDQATHRPVPIPKSIRELIASAGAASGLTPTGEKCDPPTLYILGYDPVEDHDRDRNEDQGPPHLDGDGRDAEDGRDPGQEFFFPEDDGKDRKRDGDHAQRGRTR